MRDRRVFWSISPGAAALLSHGRYVITAAGIQFFDIEDWQYGNVRAFTLLLFPPRFGQGLKSYTHPIAGPVTRVLNIHVCEGRWVIAQLQRVNPLFRCREVPIAVMVHVKATKEFVIRIGGIRSDFNDDPHALLCFGAERK